MRVLKRNFGDDGIRLIGTRRRFARRAGRAPAEGGVDFIWLFAERRPRIRSKVGDSKSSGFQPVSGARAGVYGGDQTIVPVSSVRVAEATKLWKIFSAREHRLINELKSSMRRWH